MLSPLQGPQAAYASYSPPTGSAVMFVLTNKASKEAQNQAIKMLDYLFTEEGQLRSNYGIEGVAWRKPQDGDVALNKDVKPIFTKFRASRKYKPRNDTGLIQTFSARDIPRWFGSRDGHLCPNRLRAPTAGKRRYLYDGHQPKEIFPYNAVWIDPSVVDEAAMLQKNIKDYIEQNTLQFIMGSKDLNKDWDAYVAGLEKLNPKRYLEIMQKAYDGMKK